MEPPAALRQFSMSISLDFDDEHSARLEKRPANWASMPVNSPGPRSTIR